MLCAEKNMQLKLHLDKNDKWLMMKGNIQLEGTSDGIH